MSDYNWFDPQGEGDSLPPEKLIELCDTCGHKETDHTYSPPGMFSSDGLATFDGCWADGSRYAYGDAEKDYPIPICKCDDFEPREPSHEEEAEANTLAAHIILWHKVETFPGSTVEAHNRLHRRLRLDHDVTDLRMPQ